MASPKRIKPVIYISDCDDSPEDKKLSKSDKVDIIQMGISSSNILSKPIAVIKKSKTSNSNLKVCTKDIKTSEIFKRRPILSQLFSESKK